MESCNGLWNRFNTKESNMGFSGGANWEICHHNKMDIHDNLSFIKKSIKVKFKARLVVGVLNNYKALNMMKFLH